MLELKFLEVQPAYVQQAVSQWDHFRTDELSAAGALIRESLQNSLDARSTSHVGPIRVKISIRTADKKFSQYFKNLFDPLLPHLEACNRVVDNHCEPRILLVEDFGTTGLVGSVDARDDQNFSDFWRTLGTSHKKAGSAGSWGLGRLAFPLSSVARTFFGLTIRREDGSKYLMGQSILEYHRVDGKDYVQQGFFALHRPDGFQLPVSDGSVILQFIEAVGFARTTDTGLSIAVPFVHPDLNEASIIEQIITNYYFPILTGKLSVEVGDQIIDASTYKNLASRFCGAENDNGSQSEFILELHEKSRGKPDATLSSDWRKDIDGALDEKILHSIRSSFLEGELVYVRVPLELRRKTGEKLISHIDLFLKLAKEGEKPRAIFVRDSLTIPNEAKNKFRSSSTFGALIAREPVVAEFLRNAENPAHTEWNGGGRLNESWQNAANKLRDIRYSLQKVYELLTQPVEQQHDNALRHIFSVELPSIGTNLKKANPLFVKPGPPSEIRTGRRSFEVLRHANGFTVRKGKDIQEIELPFRINLRVAYDVLRGDPFKRHSHFDFNFLDIDNGLLSISESIGALVEPTGPNSLSIQVYDPGFSIAVQGFDSKRDIRIDARKT